MIDIDMLTSVKKTNKQKQLKVIVIVTKPRVLPISIG
jgi:hypothetical protein